MEGKNVFVVQIVRVSKETDLNNAAPLKANAKTLSRQVQRLSQSCRSGERMYIDPGCMG